MLFVSVLALGSFTDLNAVKKKNKEIGGDLKQKTQKAKPERKKCSRSEKKPKDTNRGGKKAKGGKKTSMRSKTQNSDSKSED